MANPIVSNVALNKTTDYTPGEVARLTFDVSDTDTTSSTVTITVTDAAGLTGTGTIVLSKVDALTVSVSDPDRTWVKDAVASSGDHYEYTATA